MKRNHLAALVLSAVTAAVAYGATTYTTFYNLGKPGDADDNYGETIRDNMDTIDSQLNINATSGSGHTADPADAHDATAVSTVPGSFICLTQTTVQAFLNCLDGVFDPGTSGVVLLIGGQTITGAKTFGVNPIFPNAVSGILNTDGTGALSATSFSALSPLTDRGDLITRDATASVRLPVGAAGSVLKSDGTDPSWSSIVNADIDAAAAVSATKVADGSVDNTEFQRLGTAGTAGAGNLVTTDGTQTLTLKTLTAPTINNGAISGTSIDNAVIGFTSRQTAAVTTLDAASFVEGQTLNFDGTAGNGYVSMAEQSVSPSTPGSGFFRIYPKADKKLYAKDSAGTETQVGSGGTGEISVITNSSDATNWAASGAGITVATTTTAANLPLGGLVGTAIRITPVSGSDYVRYRWTQPDTLKNRKLKIQWEPRPSAGYASGDLKLEMHKHSDVGTCTYSGGSFTEFPLSTDAAGMSFIPNSTGRYTSTFDADSADCYELRIVRMAGTTALNIAAVVVGPGTQPQGAVVTEWNTTVANITSSGGGAVATGTGGNPTSILFWRRVGESMEMKLLWRWGTTSATFGTGVSYRVNIPTGYTLNTSKLNNGTGISGFLGLARLSDNSAGTFTDAVAIWAGTGDFLLFSPLDGTNIDIGPTAPFTFAVNDELSMLATVPINEWAGNGTTNVVSNEIEYASNSSSVWTADDTTSFAYGTSGNAVPPSALAASRNRRVRFLTPVSTAEVVTLELSTDQVLWLPVSQANVGITGFLSGAVTDYGVSLNGTLVSNTDVDVHFSRYRRPAGTWDAAGADWSGSTFWRLKKSKSGQAIGFGAATTLVSGLIDTQTQSFAGTKLFNSLTADTDISIVTNSSDTNGNSLYGMQQGGSNKAFIGVMGGTFPFITGAAAGDLGIMSNNTNIIFSGDNGVTTKMRMTPAGAVTISETVGGTGNVLHACTIRTSGLTASNTVTKNCNAGEIAISGGCSAGSAAYTLVQSVFSGTVGSNALGWNCLWSAGQTTNNETRAQCCVY